MKTFCFSSLIIALCTGCASLQSVSVTNIPRERGKPVEATADNVAVLGIHFTNDFADDLPDDLRAQCPNGKVTGIYSKYESTWYVLVQERSVTAKGYCVPGEKQAAAPAAPAAPTAPAAPPVPAPPPAPDTPPAPVMPLPPVPSPQAPAATSAMERRP
jgi:hypothetical protein